jgi:hypothetical protein
LLADLDTPLNGRAFGQSDSQNPWLIVGKRDDHRVEPDND